MLFPFGVDWTFRTIRLPDSAGIKGMSDSTELALVRKALTSGLSNCVEWINDRTALRVRNDPELQGLAPEGIKQEVIAFVRAGGDIKQVVETRPEYKGQRQFFYNVVLPLTGFPRGVFVEIVLGDDDPDVPTVFLVNAHPQQS